MLLTPVIALTMLLSADCGGGGSNKNPPPPRVVINPDQQFVDVGQRYVLDASETTDPDGRFEDIEFLWRIIDGGVEETDFDDHCRNDFDQICTSNDDDHCSNDEDRLCNNDDDCQNVGTCQLNSGTTSPDCTTGICGLAEGNTGPIATFVANVAGPFSVRLTARGDEANGTRTIVLDTFPSLYLVDTLIQFGGTRGDLVGEVPDADEFLTNPIQGESDPTNGNLVVIDEALGLIRVFDLREGTVLGPFGETDRLVGNPAAITFHPANNRLFAAEKSGRVQMFAAGSGLLVGTFGNVGADPLSLRISPATGDLLVVDGSAGVRVFSSGGVPQGVLGETATETDEPVDLDFLDDDTLLIADRTGKVVRCDADGEDCESFSAELDAMLASGSPSAIAVNPSAEFTGNDVLIADPAGERVIACNSDGSDCSTFGDTGDNSVDSDYQDIFFAPTTPPTTTTTLPTTTTAEEN